MNEDLESRVQEELDGSLARPERDRLAAELERDPSALAEYADQLQIEQRLRAALGEEPGLAESVVREIRMLGEADRFSQGVVGTIKRRSFARRLGELAAAGILLAAVGLALFKSPAPAGRPTLLLVVGHLPLQAGDLRVKERLESSGYRVVEALDLDVRSDDAAGKALVLISSTVLARDVLTDSGELTAKFRDSPVPLLVWEPRLFHDLGMTSGATYQQDWGTGHDQTRLVFGSPHPLGAGLSGSVVVAAAPAQFSWGRVPADAARIATLEGRPEAAAIFSYEKGAAMPGLRAPALRVGFFLFDGTSLALSELGWRIFDSAVAWSAESR